MAPFAPFGITASAVPQPESPRTLTGPGQFVCRSAGWIVDASRQVAVWRHPQGLRLQVAGIGEFAVTADGTAVLRLEREIMAATLAEAVLGPPLLLSLALHGIWCLHAGAVKAGDHAVALVGESGNGKSTLAAYLDDAGEGGWQRLADDALPIVLEPEGLMALPHYPQLKLSDASQYPVHAPARVPLAAVYVIAPPGSADPVSLHRLERRQAMQALIRHTVAARLFDKPLLAAHLDFCAAAAARIPVWRLTYPHRQECLPQVREAICRSLTDEPGGE